jgi:serine/threonine protein kinase
MLTPETVLQGRYRIIRQLGQGGMGAVYEAVDQRLDTTVALKETLFADERLRKQFEREARLLARLHHPALPRVSDHFAEGDGQFLVMQFIPGDDLSEMMTRKRGPFPADQALTWADQLLDALDYLHTQDPQIIHRDIKPQNLKLTSRGQIILLDFGLAKGQAGEVSRVTTGASIFGYTPNYAPLEQIQGLGTDSRSDLYSLGATLYHLMTGVKPPDALTRAAALVNGQPDPLAPASEVNASIGKEVDQVLVKSMAQNREQRFASAARMRRALYGTEEVSTVVNRAEAQTVLFPRGAAPTVAVPTQTEVRQPTVAAGETTVFRRSSRGKAIPIISSAAVLLLVLSGALGFYAWRKPDDKAAQLTGATPSPEETASPSPAAPIVASPIAEPEPTAAAPAPTRAARNDEPAKRPTPKPERSRDKEVNDEHDVNPPEVPLRPRSGEPNRPPAVKTEVRPGGTVIRTFPDGTSLVTMPDGTRMLVTKDGKTQVLSGPRPRRRPSPSPSP